ncbi:MAG TPA: hypothetical protein VHZ24_16045 [Pirellulales bacterium]|nr:hypothetical protein [Pirellulales bacterium]
MKVPLNVVRHISYSAESITEAQKLLEVSQSTWTAQQRLLFETMILSVDLLLKANLELVRALENPAVQVGDE